MWLALANELRAEGTGIISGPRQLRVGVMPPFPYLAYPPCPFLVPAHRKVGGTSKVFNKHMMHRQMNEWMKFLHELPMFLHYAMERNPPSRWGSKSILSSSVLPGSSSTNALPERTAVPAHTPVSPEFASLQQRLFFFALLKNHHMGFHKSKVFIPMRSNSSFFKIAHSLVSSLRTLCLDVDHPKFLLYFLLKVLGFAFMYMIHFELYMNVSRLIFFLPMDVKLL